MASTPESRQLHQLLKDRKRDRKRQYYDQHYDAIAARHKKNHFANRNARLQRMRDYDRRNREKALAQKRLYYQTNRVKILAKMKK